MKQGALKDQLAASLQQADQIFCYSEGLGWDANAVLAPLGAKVNVNDNFDALLAQIAGSAHEGDHVLIMSNGGFGGIHEKLLALLA